VSALLNAAKKFTAASDRLAAGAAAQSAADVYGETLQVLLTATAACLRPKKVGKNLHLVYELLHQQHELLALLAHPKVAPIAGPVPKLIRYFGDLIADSAEAGSLSVESAMEVLEVGVRNTAKLDGIAADAAPPPPKTAGGGGGGGGGAVDAEEFKYEYKEESDSETFFVSYVWQLVVTYSADLGWSKADIALYEDDTTGGAL
jgi:hypothetical protein